MKTGAVIVAAGSSQRMGGGDKLLQPLLGRPLIAYSISALAASEMIDDLVVVASEANFEAISALVTESAPAARVVRGGARRRDSVRAGIDALPDADIILIHDGARPMLSPTLIEAALQGAVEAGAAICAVPLADTLKQGNSGSFIEATIPREGLWLAQTPQAFRRDLILHAHTATDDDVTDDAALVEHLGEPVKLVNGSSRNIKVTTPDDFDLAEALLRAASSVGTP